MDNTSSVQIAQLPDVNELLGLDRVHTPAQTSFTVFETEEAPIGTAEQQSSRNDSNDLPTLLVDSENDAVVIDANAGGTLDLQRGSNLPEDFGMLNVDGCVSKQPHGNAVPLATPTCENGEDVAVTPDDTGAIQEQVDNEVGNVQIAQAETLQMDMNSGQRSSRKRKRDHDIEGTTEGRTTDASTANLQRSKSNGTNVRPSDITVPTEVITIATTTEAATVPHPRSQGMRTNMQPRVRSSEHLRVPVNIPSQGFRHPTPAEMARAAMARTVIPPTSSLGRLPPRLRDMLLMQARCQTYAGIETRALIMAENAAVEIHRMERNGEITIHPRTMHTASTSQPNTPTQGARAVSIPSPSGAMRTRSRTSPRGQSARTPPLPTPAAQMTSSRRQEQVTYSQNAPPLNIPHKPVNSSMKKTHSNDSPLSFVSSADSQSNSPASPPHPKRSIAPSRPKLPAIPVHDQYLQHMAAPTQLVHGAGPSNINVTEREATAANGAAEVISATFNKLVMMPAASWKQSGAPASNHLLAPQLVPEPPVTTGTTAPETKRQASQKRNGPKLRFSKNAAASNYCHICGRCSKTVAVFDCANRPIGLCRKVLCEKCLIIHEPEMVQWAKQRGAGWLCTHCRSSCPSKARCVQYNQNNQKRRQNNRKKKLQEKQKKRQDQNAESKRRRRSDGGDEFEDSPVGIADSIF